MAAKNAVLTDVRRDLKRNATKKARESGRTFFKEEVTLYGVTAARLKSVSKRHFKTIEHQPKKQVLALCEALWRAKYLEEGFIACEWSYALRKSYTPDDFKVFERWVQRYVNNWASCDSLCNHTVGTLIEMYPEFLPRLMTWALSRNRWVRRASAVSLIVPARKGLFLKEIFEIADILLMDKDDMVQKGYGWMLKVASKPHLQEVFDYVQRNKAVMPRTALRYAIELMPEDMRKAAMAKGGA
jgi:3-methyladenine DNA glycosylase AlkD